MNQTSPADPRRTSWGLEWWYSAHFTFGVTQNVFIPILVPEHLKDIGPSLGG